MIETVRICPLGGTCERIWNGKLEQCIWLIELEGKNPQTGEFMKKKECSMAILPLLLIQATEANKEVASATDSVRNVLYEGLKNVQNPENSQLRLAGVE